MGCSVVCCALLLGHVVSLGLGASGRAGALVEVFLQEPQATGSAYVLQGALLDPQGPNPSQEVVRGSLILVGDLEPEVEEEDSWIGVFPVGEEQGEIQRGRKEESFTAAVVSKMKRALVLGASALLILALNQNAIREGLAGNSKDDLPYCAPRKLGSNTYTVVNVWTVQEWAVWRMAGRDLYRRDQFASTGIQKYLQQLWNTILLVALILCTGLVVQAQRQSRQHQSEEDPQLDLKQHILQRLSALKTRRYHPSKHRKSQAPEIETCAVCLDQFHRNQCLRVMPCLHEFHRDCVDPWLLLQHTCPLCKYNILGNLCGES
uniref:RING finger protein 215 n=1 Tax=Geotrypetes seraphini TaxID=260995 RepID=A0A6P8S1A6_GEOSA|nr:RING finger protein 215 isoform X2 [Geotrypetes seraphini]